MRKKGARGLRGLEVGGFRTDQALRWSTARFSGPILHCPIPTESMPPFLPPPTNRRALFEDHRCPEPGTVFWDVYSICVIEWFMKRSNCYLDYADLKPAVGGAGRTSCAHTSARIDMAGFLREVVIQPACLPDHPLFTPAPAAD